MLEQFQDCKTEDGLLVPGRDYCLVNSRFHNKDRTRSLTVEERHVCLEGSYASRWMNINNCHGADVFKIVDVGTPYVELANKIEELRAGPTAPPSEPPVSEVCTNELPDELCEATKEEGDCADL